MTSVSGLSLARGVEWGVEFAKAALAAGNGVVATGRNTDSVRTAVGEAEDLLVAQLDVTSPEEAGAAVEAAV